MADIAIIGMACLLPGAGNLRQYWQNVLAKVSSIGEPPPDWEAAEYATDEVTTNDRTYTTRGGYLGDLARFDPLEHGVMPNALDGGEPDHFLTLRVAGEALADAGYSRDTLSPERTEVILGRGTYINRGVTGLFQHAVVMDQTIDIIRQLRPDLDEAHLARIKAQLKEQLPPFNVETTPAMIPNILSGRIANRLDLMGPNYIVDAACASSLIAVELGMSDLAAGKCDMALVGGINATITPPTLMMFSQLGALSRQPTLRAFDQHSDGTMLGEGLGMIVLKRLADAQRDGDRVYAVLKAVGVASDGRAQGLLAPRLEGQALAIRRAYEAAGIDPRTVELVEAHGTGVPLGDATEVRSLTSVFGPRDEADQVATCGLGSVKTSLGHLLTAAGMAGLIKTALALYHRVLPPMAGCDEVNADLHLERTPFYINTEARPWVHGSTAAPRRAGVNAFGFGGINAHAILEEYTGTDDEARVHLHRDWDAELFLLGSDSRETLGSEARALARRVAADEDLNLTDLAFTLSRRDRPAAARLAIVSGSRDDLVRKLEYAAERLADAACSRVREKQGIYFFDEPLGHSGKVAFLFPGEGSQYPGMLADLCLHFPEVRSYFDRMDRALAGIGRRWLPSQAVFPPPGTDRATLDRLWEMDTAAEAVFVASQALADLMRRFEVRPDVVLGHSTGEYSALVASGAIDCREESRFVELVLGVNRTFEEFSATRTVAEGVLLNVGGAEAELVERLVAESGGALAVAMHNCPHQYVLCGQEPEITRAETTLREQGALPMRLPFNRAYHTPAFDEFGRALRAYYATLDIAPPAVEMYSCATAGPFPPEPEAIRDLLAAQWSRPVRFQETIAALYERGVRTFVEVGPRANLTAFVDNILKRRPYLAVASNVHYRPGIVQLEHMLGLLYAHHVPLNPALLYAHRAPQLVDLSAELGASASAAGGPQAPSAAGPQAASAAGRRLVPIRTVLPRVRLSAELCPPLPSAAAASGAVSASGALRNGAAAHSAPQAQGAPAADGVPVSGALANHTSPNGAAATRTAATGPVAIQPTRGLPPVAQPPTAQPPVLQPPVAHPPTAQPPAVPLLVEATPTHTSVESATGHRAPVVASYLESMRQYLVAQTDVFEAYFARRHGGGIPLTTTIDLPARAPFQQMLPGAQQYGAQQNGAPPTGAPVAAAPLSEWPLPTTPPPAPSAAIPVAALDAAFPLVTQVESLEPARRVVATAQLDLARHPFLADHRLGGRVSRADASVAALPVVPLTFSMEIVAEAAALLAPGLVLVGMREVRAHRWIGLDDGTRHLRVVAEHAGSEADRTIVRARLLDVEPPPWCEAAPDAPIVEAELIFAAAYPSPPPVAPLELADARTSTWQGRDLYDGFMFHGPSLQAVASVDACGADGVMATLRAMPEGPLFDLPPAAAPPRATVPALVTDPVTLDAAGQVLGYWTTEQLTSGFHIFPYRLEALDVYGPRLAVPETARCQARIALEGDTLMRSDIDVIDSAGRLRLRLRGWWDRRFAMADAFHHLLCNLGGTLASHVEVLDPCATATGCREAKAAAAEAARSNGHSAPVQGRPALTHGRSAPDEAPLVCAVFDAVSADFLTAHDRIWERVLAHLVLSRRERQQWWSLAAQPQRRLDWLSGRVAAKDAVRGLARRQWNLDLLPADIEIANGDEGQPRVQILDPAAAGRRAVVSLAHTAVTGVAVAADEAAGLSLGIDAEYRRRLDEGFDSVAFNSRERQLLAALPAAEQPAAMLRIWCAKEAVTKALGRDVAGTAGQTTVRALDSTAGIAAVQLEAGSRNEEAARNEAEESNTMSANGSSAVRQLAVSLLERGDLVIAVTSVPSWPADESAAPSHAAAGTQAALGHVSTRSF